MAAPVGNCVELDAVGELHFVGLLKLADLLCPLGFPFEVPCVPMLLPLYSSVVSKLVLFEICQLVLTRCKGAPSSNTPTQGVVIRRARLRAPWNRLRGGMSGQDC